MREPVEERRRRIQDILDQHDQVKVAHLAALLNVSVVTARRDLESMEQAGLVQRRHGMVAAREAAEDHSLDPTVVHGTVAIVAPQQHSYLAAITQGARRSLERAGFRTVLHPVPPTGSAEKNILTEIARQGADGVLLAPRWRTREDELNAEALLEGVHLPVVLLERRPESPLALRSLDSVCSDHWFGIESALKHLTESGHRRILLAARTDSPTARTVREAFYQLASDHPQIEYWLAVDSEPAGPSAADSDTPAPSAHRPAVDYQDPHWFPKLIREHSITAAVIHSDENALVLTQRLISDGIRIPEDCAVVAYDDVVAGLGTIPLTAVSPPRDAVGRTAAHVLIQRLRAERSGTQWVPQRIQLLPQLQVRSSS